MGRNRLDHVTRREDKIMRSPSPAEDARNLVLIAGSAFAAVLATIGLAEANHAVAPSHVSAPAPLADLNYRLVEPLSGSNRVYGTVTARDGRTHEGFLRWDRNEGSWSDMLDLTKLDRGFTGLSGVRFGHVRHIRSLGRNQALFTLRSGHQVGMRGHSTDLGRAMRDLKVSSLSNDETSLQWDDISEVSLMPAPPGATPSGGRLHGTLKTTSGLRFTGYITWDVDEIYSTDILDGKTAGFSYEIPFGAVDRIHREDRRSARVLLHSGESLTLSGTNDVNRENRGITVSDPGLGQVKVQWDDFAFVRFHGTDSEASWNDFDGGRQLRGTVITAAGDELSGEITWDQDEYQSWEMLNGSVRGAELDIEFSNIARIVKYEHGSAVVLRDGRSLTLSGSNDVDSGNRGIVVTSDGESRTVKWADFRELRLDW